MAQKNAWQGGFVATLYQGWLGANYAFDLLVSGGTGMLHTQMDMGLGMLQRVPLLPDMFAKKILVLATIAVQKTIAQNNATPVPKHQLALAYIRLARAQLCANIKHKHTRESLERIYQQLEGMRKDTDPYNQKQLASVLVHLGILSENMDGVGAYVSGDLYAEAAFIAKEQDAKQLHKKALRLWRRRMLQNTSVS